MKQKVQADAAFKKEELLQADRYQEKRDLVSALLEYGREYTLAEADAAIDKFLKGKVR